MGASSILLLCYDGYVIEFELVYIQSMTSDGVLHFAVAWFLRDFLEENVRKGSREYQEIHLRQTNFLELKTFNGRAC